jgi:hypothetical protein
VGPRPVLPAMAGLGVGRLLVVVALRRPLVGLDVDEDGALVDARRAVRAEEPVVDVPPGMPLEGGSAGLAAAEATEQ